MFEEQFIQLRGSTFTLEIMSHSAGRSPGWWGWYYTDGMAAPSGMTQELNQEFIRHWTTEKISAATQEEAICLRVLLPAMGVGMDQLKELGLVERTTEEIDEERRERRFSVLPDAGHSPVNCIDLLKWAVAGRAIEINARFCLIGDGPFSQDGLKEIATASDVLCHAIDEDFGQAFISFYARTGKVFLSTCYVVGRENWDENQIDELIDENEGQQLKFYSQEMFASYLMTGKDPFEGGLDVLTAFRVDHPALEHLSQGWPGWVTSTVTTGRGHRVGRGHLEITRQTGLLKYMGYTVGNNGLPDSERQTILANVFRCDLTEFDAIADASYLHEWGEPQSGTRLRKIAESIATFCRKMRLRSNASEQAIADWEADLHWLNENYYKGAMRFAWPQTTVRRP